MSHKCVTLVHFQHFNFLIPMYYDNRTKSTLAVLPRDQKYIVCIKYIIIVLYVRTAGSDSAAITYTRWFFDRFRSKSTRVLSYIYDPVYMIIFYTCPDAHSGLRFLTLTLSRKVTEIRSGIILFLCSTV